MGLGLSVAQQSCMLSVWLPFHKHRSLHEGYVVMTAVACAMTVSHTSRL